MRPGRHLPDGALVETPDDRSGAQRCHDGIKLALKAGIASGALGAHRGHPVTVIVRTTLAGPQPGRPRRHQPRGADAGPGARRR